MRHLLLPTMIAAGLSVAGSASAQQSPLLLVQSKDWSAVTAGSQKGKVCYALSKPTKLDPQTLNHGDVFFFISTRPGENVRNEPSIQVGYPFKEGSKVTVDVDGQKFNLFTRGDGAWLETPAEEAKLLDSLKRGKKLTVGGQSGRGNQTTYSFSLAGLQGAVDAIAKECK
ncbi:invasion associated locus B family protein [Prosthecomicrobium sp. N25]|uniref:invasion associated locus B family protein n=1 Tax=Prosthecomicrobium sp. N25 TaxID=3129254 RepID=UPI003076CB13